MNGLRRALLMCAWVTALCPARAVERPKGPVVLTVTGKIGELNAEMAYEFDMDMLAALPQSTLVTATPWHPQPTRFTGPLLKDVLKQVKAQGETLQLTALNAFQSDLPISDTLDYQVVLVRLVNDQAIRVRDKGPLLIMYPFDRLPKLRSQMFYRRAVWQLRHMEVR